MRSAPSTENRLAKEQNYGNHRRYMPLHHFIVQPIIAANFFVQAWQFSKNMTLATGWNMVVAFALLIFVFSARIMSLTAQNRSIRLEERLRLMRLMPPEEHKRIGELATRHLVGLRFAPDNEVVALAKRCLDGELKTAGDVKKNIREWRADYLRV